jgi:hypothetical protein
MLVTVFFSVRDDLEIILKYNMLKIKSFLNKSLPLQYITLVSAIWAHQTGIPLIPGRKEMWR